MKTIALTGATGFVGRAVLRELHARGVKVVVFSRHPMPPGWGNTGVWVQGGIEDEDPSLFERLQTPDVLIHLAWGGLPNYRSFHHFERELPLHYRFLESLVTQGLPAMVVAGTCLEYGLRDGCLSEDMTPAPHLAYPLAKNTLRAQLELLSAEKEFRLCWARLFYMYGEGQAPTSLRSQLLESISRGDESFNMSGGEQLRDFLRVEAVANILVSLSLVERQVGVVNVCSGKPRSVRSLVEEWLSELDSDIRLNLGHFSYPDYEPMAFWGNRKKLDSILTEKAPART